MSVRALELTGLSRIALDGTERRRAIPKEGTDLRTSQVPAQPLYGCASCPAIDSCAAGPFSLVATLLQFCPLCASITAFSLAFSIAGGGGRPPGTAWPAYPEVSSSWCGGARKPRLRHVRSVASPDLGFPAGPRLPGGAPASRRGPGLPGGFPPRVTSGRRGTHMHVGMAAVFQNPGRARERSADLPERARARRPGRAAGLRVDLVASSTTSPTTRCAPTSLQFLSYMAGRTTHVQLGSMVVVLPWHDPMRVAEQISMLDHLSGGRMILGLGRGAGKVEFDGFRARHGRQPRAVRRIRRGAARGPRERRNGIRRQALPPAARRRSGPPRSRASAAAPMRRPSSPESRRASWPSSASAS